MRTMESILSETTQKSQESQQALELLFEEKKKVKQLEQQLLIAHKEKALHNENLKKSLASGASSGEIARLQKQLAESEEEIKLLHAQQKRLKDLYRQQQQEVTLLQDSLKASQQTSKEINAVRLALNETKTTLNEALEQNRQKKQQIDQLSASLQDKEQQICDLQYIESSYKRLVAKSAEPSPTQENHHAKIRQLQEEQQSTKASLEEAQQHSRQLERVIQFLRERAEEAQLEIKQTVSEFQTSQEAIATLKEEVQSAKQEWSDLSVHYTKEKQAKQALIKELQELQNQFDNLKQQHLDAQSVIANRDQTLQDLQHQLGYLRDEKRRFDRKSTTIDDYEMELNTAFKARDEARRRAISIEEELFSLTEQHRILKEKFDKLRAQQESERDETELLREQLSTVQRRIGSFESEKREILELSDKQKFAFLELKSSMDTRDKAHQEERLMAKKQGEELLLRLEQNQKQMGALQEELRQLENTKKEFIEKEEHYKRSIQDLKSSLIARESSYQEESSQSQEERRTLQERIEAAEMVYKERDLLQEGLKHHQAELEKLTLQLQQTKESHHSAEAQWKQKLFDYETKSQHEQQLLEHAHHEMEVEIRSRQTELEAKIQSHQETLLHKEKQIEELRTRASQLVQEKHINEDELNKARRRADDSDAKAQMAHQHLAKKVKETAILSEKIEEQKGQLLELQKQHGLMQQRATDLQHSLEMHLSEKQKIEEKLQTTIVEIETQTRKWEEKYFHMCQQWERTEAQNTDLRKQKDKLDQLESILSNIGTVMKNTAAAGSHPQVSSPPFATEKAAEAKSEEIEFNVEEIQEEKIKETSHQPSLFEDSPIKNQEKSVRSPLKEDAPSPNLFDIYRQQQKPKRNLFDE